MVTPRKSESSLSLIREEKSQMLPSSSKSTESLYSNTSSSKSSAKLIYGRKTLSIPARGTTGCRQPTLIPATTEVRQRVLSARRLRMKTYQNQLADAQQHIAELAHENRILHTLHKRQDSALSKYESTNAELPQLLHSHAEEVRFWQTKYRNLQGLHKDLLQKLKQKEALILSLSDQNKYYSQLNKDKNLADRQRLSEKVQSMEMQLKEKDNEMKLLARRLQLESKNFKKQLQEEQKKSKDAFVKFEKTKLELSGYKKIEDLNLNEKLSNLSVEAELEQHDHKKSSSIDLAEDMDTLEQDQEENATTEFSNQSTHTKYSIRKVSFPEIKLSSDRGEQHLGGGDAPLLDRTSKSKPLKKDPSTESSNPDYEEDYEDIDDEGDEQSSEDDEEDLILSTERASKQMKNDIENIRKQIADEYKGRETFLDSYCRDATAGCLVDFKGKTTDISVGIPKTPGNRKSKLLAALKAIDDHKSEDLS